MYLARFSSEAGEFQSAALQWPVSTGAGLPPLWLKLLAKWPEVDLAFRVETGQSGNPRALLMLTVEATAGQMLLENCAALQRAHQPGGLVVPSTMEEFDRLAVPISGWQLRVNYSDYYHAGHPLACDFRLYPMVASESDAGQIVYQCHLREHRPNPETERRVRKYLAWLEIEQPFTGPVRAMQRMLALRLLQRGSLAGEYAVFQERDALERFLTRIETHFRETIGRIGFPEAPVETGDFSDWLCSGRHPSRDAGYAPSLPGEAAALFGEPEAQLLLTSKFAAGRNPPPEEGGAPGLTDIFISYASSDFAFASSACDHLEQKGLVCWIAPRDINRDILPYTEAITRAIARARAVVVMVSDSANLSVHIPRELDLALERKLCIVPVRLQDVLPTGQLNYMLRTCQWLNAYGRDYLETMDELLSRLRRLMN